MINQLYNQGNFYSGSIWFISCSRVFMIMINYKNISGESGVTAYETGPDYIKIRFLDGEIYTYTFESAGRDTVEKMKVLAEKGKGLSTYISRYVREKYAEKGSPGR